MLRRELDHDFGVLGTGVVTRKKRDRVRLRQIDIVAHLFEFISRNYLPD